MHSALAARMRLARAACGMRGVHATAAPLAGRNKTRFKDQAIAKRKENTEWYEDEEAVNDDDSSMAEWEFDNHHTYGHLLLESIRDVRKYARQIKYELPTLAEHAKPFQPPPAQNVLRFERSVTMGEKFQAQDRKVVLRVKVAQLGLAAPELHKLVLLAGPRYNPETDELKMSEKRELTSLLNKKRLADMFTALLAEAKKADDGFADVPLDFSHHKRKPDLAFPSAWLPKLNKSSA
ncbi:37S ribosomal protein S24, mitochondrial [Coemansia nantahalensis]|uniref:37S ribosomal protein S24, mitochondrial n=1 Tax=Coemansia nantahalensis TaxID=2789366 RepID=A0ACC1K3Y2_9FUNG|nr:37S ribosomal protein S24, mitochondrial [Coemansia nantahalensis]